MISKFVILAILASLAVAHAAKLSSENTKLVSKEKEGRFLLEIPILGALIVKSIKVVWFLVKSAWSLIGLKLTILAFVAHAAIWVFNNSFSAIVGAAAMLAFCKLTGKCTLDYVPDQLIEVGETLVYAARNLEDGVAKYGGGELQ